MALLLATQLALIAAVVLAVGLAKSWTRGAELGGVLLVMVLLEFVSLLPGIRAKLSPPNRP
jgi:hypothetical protein